MDASKQLLQVGLDDVGVGSLSQDLQEIVIPNEVETRENGPFFLNVGVCAWGGGGGGGGGGGAAAIQLIITCSCTCRYRR